MFIPAWRVALPEIVRRSRKVFVPEKLVGCLVGIPPINPKKPKIISLHQILKEKLMRSYDHLYRELLAVPGGGSERPDALQARIEALFRQAKRRLMAAGRQICEATEDVAVFGRMPLILGDPRPDGPGVRQLEAIRAGLDALHKDRHFSVDK